MSDKAIFQSQLEHMQSKYVGAGNSDITKHDWLTQQHRDTTASYIGHPQFLTYFSVANNQSLARTRYDLLLNMYNPCGVDPAVQLKQQQKHDSNSDMKEDM